MVHSFVQYVFITAIGIMIIGLIAPAFYISDKKTDKLLTQFVIPIDNANDANLGFTVSHIEKLLLQPQLAANNIALVATGKGVRLFATDSKYQVRLQQLLAKGVQMFACQRSLHDLQQSGQQLLAGVVTIADGRQYVDTLMEQGFTNNFA